MISIRRRPSRSAEHDREITLRRRRVRLRKLAQAAALGAELRSLSSVLGLAQVGAGEFLKLQSSHERVAMPSPGDRTDDGEIEQRIAIEIAARKARMGRVDRIRESS